MQISCASFCKGLCNPFVKQLGRLCGACPSTSVGRHVVTAAQQSNLKIVSKIVIFDFQKSNFFRPAGAVQRGSVCTLSLIEPVQCVSRRSHNTIINPPRNIFISLVRSSSCAPPPQRAPRVEQNGSPGSSELLRIPARVVSSRAVAAVQVSVAHGRRRKSRRRGPKHHSDQSRRRVTKFL
jgi:hypothetical protein